MDFAKINLDDNQVIAREIIERANNQNFKNRHDFEKFRNSLIKEHKGKIFHNLYFIKAYNDLLKEGRISENQDLLSLIRKRSVRTLSGVAPVTVMTKPFPCPGRCVYCPTDVRMPKSYLPSQPAAQRAFRQRFNPYTQVFVRLKALHMTGHKISKVELRVIGGTWSAYPKRYQKWFIKQCLRALNEFSEQVRAKKISQMKDLVKENIVKSPYGEDTVTTVVLKPLNSFTKFEDVVKINETSDVRCIGINIETRPDFIDEKEIKQLRSFGVTKVEMGVQTVDDEVQKITGRGHDLVCVKCATKLLKDAGMKVGYHMMPNLPGSTVELDKRMVGELFADEGYQPDYLKIYPCVVVSKSRLMSNFKKGLYKPYNDDVLKEVLLEELKSVPEWCRIDRIARDIPSTELIAGFKSSNIRQILEKELIEKVIPCRDIRSREVKNEVVSNVELVVRKYSASGGEELFLSYEDKQKDKLVALLRLRFPCKTFLPELKNSALIREIHVYGKQIAVGEKDKGEKQHVGWGTKLMQSAEELTKEAGYKKIAVIAGIGTREYYRKKGYKLYGTYMVKVL